MTPQVRIGIPSGRDAIRIYVYPAGENLMPLSIAFRANLRKSGFTVRSVAKSLAIAVIASLSGLSTVANAADDTFSCLSELDGSLTELRGITEYFENDWFNIPDGSRFDARGAAFLAQTDPLLSDGSIITYPVDLRADLANSFCWAGGVVRYTNDADITWADSKHPNNAAVISIAGRAIFDGVRIHNAHDGIRPRRNPRGWWEIRNSWISYNRDDCIENDGFAAGLVDDSLFDGCYVFLSSRVPDATNYGNTVTVQNSLIRMQEMPGPYGHDDPSVKGHGPLFKYQAESPDLVLRNNIFLMESYVSTKYTIRSRSASASLLGFQGGKLAACSGNVIVWTGPGEFPGNIPADSSCVTVTTDMTVWENARATWLAEHPLVARIDGVDEPAPVPDPEPIPEPEPEPTPGPEPDTTLEPLPESSAGTTTEDTQDPSLTIISPVRGTRVFPSTAIWVEVYVSDNVGVDRLEVHIDQNSPMVFEGGGTHGFNWDIPESWWGNRHSIMFVAYDLAGNSESKLYRFRMPKWPR